MAAVIRLKRFLEEEPIEAFVLTCKRRKIATKEEENLSSTVVTFAGTLSMEDNILTHFKDRSTSISTNLVEMKEKYKKHKVTINDKLRNSCHEHCKNSRYKVIQSFRAKNLEDLDTTLDRKLTVFDLETDSNEEESNVRDQNDNAENKQYVYDLYYTNSDDFGDTEIEDYVSIHPFNGPLLFNQSKDQPESDSNDSEDSNAENNWRNDYPDESDMDSINEDDMMEAMNNITINDDLLSSDEGEEGFVYSIDREAAEFEEDVDDFDVLKYGEQYARFKARNKRKVESTGLDHDFYYGDIDEDDYCY